MYICNNNNNNNNNTPCPLAFALWMGNWGHLSPQLSNASILSSENAEEFHVNAR